MKKPSYYELHKPYNYLIQYKYHGNWLTHEALATKKEAIDYLKDFRKKHLKVRLNIYRKRRSR